MSNNYEIKDILSAVDVLLNDKGEKILKLSNENKVPLLLKNEVKNSKEKLNNIPKDTEKIILEAEKYLKK
tara:strand:+ start:2549 stop:2758 length:210 start_codon:yes stop_codon:yes gene_type:complete